MTKVVNRIGGNYYKLKVDDAGEIILDVGDSGKVTIAGDLDVLGEQTSIGSTDLIVSDNTITVNEGESGAGVSLGTAGLIVDRGTENNSEFLFNESLNSIRNGTIVTGSFVFQDNTQASYGIHTSSISTQNNENLYLLNNSGLGIITVNQAGDYEKSVFNYDVNNNIEFNASAEDNLEPIGVQIDQTGNSYDEDALITARLLIDYTRSYHLYNFQNKILSDDLTPSSVIANSESVVINVNGDANNVAFFTETNVDLYGLTIRKESNITADDSLLQPASTSANLILRGNGLGIVQNDDYLNLTKQNNPLELGEVGAPTDGVTLYGDTLADGGTGLFFVNQDGTNDEIASRNKALLFSIIF